MKCNLYVDVSPGVVGGRAKKRSVQSARSKRVSTVRQVGQCARARPVTSSYGFPSSSSRCDYLAECKKLETFTTSITLSEGRRDGKKKKNGMAL